jgi:hypothetical protein
MVGEGIGEGIESCLIGLVVGLQAAMNVPATVIPANLRNWRRENFREVGMTFFLLT